MIIFEIGVGFFSSRLIVAARTIFEFDICLQLLPLSIYLC